MTHADRDAVATIALEALIALLWAGPALGQETTTAGMGDEGTTTEGETMDGGNESTTDDGTSAGGSTSADGTTDGEMAADVAMGEEMTTGGDGTVTDESMGTGAEDTSMDGDETAAGGQPGFGLLVGLLALPTVVAVAIVAGRRN